MTCISYNVHVMPDVAEKTNSRSPKTRGRRTLPLRLLLWKTSSMNMSIQKKTRNPTGDLATGGYFLCTLCIYWETAFKMPATSSCHQRAVRIAYLLREPLIQILYMETLQGDNSKRKKGSWNEKRSRMRRWEAHRLRI